ncbi:hypothetical protein AWW69_05820 [Bacillus cereus]|nr:hypothetical protein AWW69_05820 [Bacillus cereus]
MLWNLWPTTVTLCSSSAASYWYKRQGVHPYRVKLAMNQTKFFSFEELKKVIIELAEADYSMKTGKMDKKLVLEFFLMRLNHM